MIRHQATDVRDGSGGEITRSELAGADQGKLVYNPAEKACAAMESDVVVVGGGSAGCALVGRLCQLGPFRIVLLEAGPHYGPASSGPWPAELPHAPRVPATHPWGLLEEDGAVLRTPQ